MCTKFPEKGFIPTYSNGCVAHGHNVHLLIKDLGHCTACGKLGLLPVPVPVLLKKK